MRGHRSRSQLPALALLLGAAGALSLAQGATGGLARHQPAGLEAPSSATAIHAPAWGEAMEPQRGSVGRTIIHERTGPKEGGGARPPRMRPDAERIAATGPAPALHGSPPRLGGFGARLLGLERSPANAPPRS